MLKTDKILDLFDFYEAKTLSTREEADKLFDFINTLDISTSEVNSKENTINSTNEKFHISYLKLDFSKIEFISRSFADQFIKNEANYKSGLNVTFEFINIDDTLRKIFEIVSNTQTEEIRKTSKSVRIISYRTFLELHSYLASI